MFGASENALHGYIAPSIASWQMTKVRTLKMPPYAGGKAQN